MVGVDLGGSGWIWVDLSWPRARPRSELIRRVHPIANQLLLLPRSCLALAPRARASQELSARGFSPVRLAAATGRHFALVATKASDDADGHLGQIDDKRQETAKVDTHLKTWEAKSEQQ